MRKIAFMLMLLAATVAMANDGVFYASGNQLVPLQQTDIRVVKEVLTMSLTDFDYTTVDVQYEFMNDGPEQTVLMGFEATPGYNSEWEINKEGRHPYIYDFTVEMNGQKLDYKNAVSRALKDTGGQLDKVDLDKWKMLDYPQYLVNDEDGEDNGIFVSYVYYFDAKFKKGLNRVHHTYSYKNSMRIDCQYIIDYLLSPALRWANGRIDDFTLRIEAKNTAKYFVVGIDLPNDAKSKEEGEVRGRTFFDEGKKMREMAIRNGAIEWNAKNFCPKGELEISSADTHVYGGVPDKFVLGAYYDRSESYMPGSFMFAPDGLDARILRNLPYASRGYVFKDKKLREYFGRFFWYMPDPEYKPDTSDFTPMELELIKNK